MVLFFDPSGTNESAMAAAVCGFRMETRSVMTAGIFMGEKWLRHSDNGGRSILDISGFSFGVIWFLHDEGEGSTILSVCNPFAPR
jgi:hypothetical protein